MNNARIITSDLKGTAVVLGFGDNQSQLPSQMWGSNRYLPSVG